MRQEAGDHDVTGLLIALNKQTFNLRFDDEIGGMPLSRISVKAPHTGGARRRFKLLGMKRNKEPVAP